ncbi:MAG: FadR/GntR family transcriptional regulator [Acidobacteriaceae bacterium]
MRVVEHLRQMIQKGELEPGARLPTERALAQRLKVSRSSLRAGIGFLSAMGVLKSRHGSGTYVAEGPPAFDASMLQMMGSLHGYQPLQMFEARLVIEQSLAGFAAERASDQHLATLAEEVAEMYAALDNPQEYLIHDVRFHRTLAAAAANPILTVLMETITAALYGQRRETVIYSQDMKESADMHREIYRAVRTRDVAKARSIMALHLGKAQSAQAREVTANSATRAGKRTSSSHKSDGHVAAT